jgi:hypothetical protein
MEKSEEKFNSLLHYFLCLITDPEAASKLTQMLTSCMKEQGKEPTILALLPKRDVFHVNKQKCISREFKMTTELCGYDMDGVMLDLGSNLNIFPKKPWEVMGNPKLVWSSIQLQLAN